MAQQKQNKSPKVGTDPKALHEFGGKGDFGIPARDNVLRDHEGTVEGRPAGTRMGDAPADHDRTVGVGSDGTNPGQDSGGDIDTDFVGVGGPTLAAKAPFREQTDAETAKDPSRTFASGKRAAGQNAIKPHTHGTAPSVKGDSLDHSGESQYTGEGRAAGAVNPAHDDTPGAEGEITQDEATGDPNQGADN